MRLTRAHRAAAEGESQVDVTEISMQRVGGSVGRGGQGGDRAQPP